MAVVVIVDIKTDQIRLSTGGPTPALMQSHYFKSLLCTAQILTKFTIPKKPDISLIHVQAAPCTHTAQDKAFIISHKQTGTHINSSRQSTTLAKMLRQNQKSTSSLSNNDKSLGWHVK